MCKTIISFKKLVLFCYLSIEKKMALKFLIAFNKTSYSSVLSLKNAVKYNKINQAIFVAKEGM